jgi:hypothetical protein
MRLAENGGNSVMQLFEEELRYAENEQSAPISCRAVRWETRLASCRLYR